MTFIADITVRVEPERNRPLVDAVPEGVVRVLFVFGSDDAVVSYVLVPHDSVARIREAIHGGGSERDGGERDGGERDGNERAANNGGESAIERVRPVDEFGDHAVVQLTYPRRSDAILTHLVDTGLGVLEGLAMPGRWTFRVRARNSESIDRFTSDCIRHGATASVDRLRKPNDGNRADTPVLTPAQRRTLYVAQASGYFKVPRETSLVELSDRLDVSDSAVSQRLRRGIDATLAARFADEDPPTID